MAQSYHAVVTQLPWKSNQGVSVCITGPTLLFLCRLASNILIFQYFHPSLEEPCHISGKKSLLGFWLGLCCSPAESVWESSHLVMLSLLIHLQRWLWIYRQSLASFQIWTPFVYFPYLTLPVRTPHTILNRSVENGRLTTSWPQTGSSQLQHNWSTGSYSFQLYTSFLLEESTPLLQVNSLFLT